MTLDWTGSPGTNLLRILQSSFRTKSMNAKGDESKIRLEIINIHLKYTMILNHSER